MKAGALTLSSLLPLGVQQIIDVSLLSCQLICVLFQARLPLFQLPLQGAYSLFPGFYLQDTGHILLCSNRYMGGLDVVIHLGE